jgi:hypothetical protein
MLAQNIILVLFVIVQMGKSSDLIFKVTRNCNSQIKSQILKMICNQIKSSKSYFKSKKSNLVIPCKLVIAQ